MPNTIIQQKDRKFIIRMNLYFRDISVVGSFELKWTSGNWSSHEQEFTRRGKDYQLLWRERDIKGKPSGDYRRQVAGGYSKFLATGFHSPDALISDSFSLDMGRRSRPSRISSTSLSIKRENASLPNRR